MKLRTFIAIALLIGLYVGWVVFYMTSYVLVGNSYTKPTMTCYSPHDVYKVYDYEIVDDNKTLITSHGRIYHISECTKDK